MFAARISNLTESPVREILKVIDQPGMISFAGGLPAAECFPQLNWSGVGQEYLQYGPSEGEHELREQVAAVLCERGLPTRADRVLILSGSQQGIDLVAKLMIETATKVAVESPTYLAALQAFDLFGARYSAFEPSEPDLAGASLSYTIPTFQNPTGHCYTRQQRQDLALACDRTGCVLFEDDPYRELAYSECDRTPVCSYIDNAPWIYQSSFSKTYAPGLRLGYLTCSDALFPHLVRLKQAADLHSCRVSQRLVTDLLKKRDNSYAEQISFYRDRRDYFNQVLHQHFSDIAQWSVPEGGLFFWLKLKPAYSVDTRLLLQRAISEGVAFMPGESFYPSGSSPVPSLRLNFSHAPGDLVEPGLARLAEIFKSTGEGRV